LLLGQSANTSLRGTVTDPSGALLPGATVSLVNKANGATALATANSAGLYIFPQIPPATYAITVSAAGFGAQTKTAELLVNQPATVNFMLTVQASTVTVDVSATAETLNTTDATLGNSVGNTVIQALPMEGRNPLALLTLQPGVLYLGDPSENDTLDTRSGTVNGGRSDQGNVTLDGMDDNDQLYGTAFTGVLRSTLDSTEEFRVTTSNGGAESGRSSGAEISLVTKSGSNQLHGALYEYYRPTNTVANEWFLKETQLSLGEPNIPQKYVMNTFGGSAGGPIRKDKLFFFVNYEGQRKAISQIVDQTLPTALFYAGELGYQNTGGTTTTLSSGTVSSMDSGCTPNPVPCGPNANAYNYYEPLQAATFVGVASTVGDGINSAGYIFASPNPSTLNTSIAKLDYTFSGRQRIFIRGNLQKDTTAGVENLPGQPPSSFYDDNTKGLAAGHTWTPTGNIVNDLRYGYIRQGYADRGAGTGTGDWVNFRFLAQPAAQVLSTVVNVPVHNITDTLTWTKGNHTVTLGGNWRGIWNNRSSDQYSYTGASTNAYWMYPGPPTPANVASGFLNSYDIAYSTLVGTVPQTNQQYNYSVSSAASGTLMADGAFINRHFKSNEFEYFIQDSWRVTPNLNLTYGIHHTLLQVPYETHGQQIAPTVDTYQWFRQRGEAAALGNVFEDNLTFAPSGKMNHGSGYWAEQKNNLAPRLSIAWGPNSRTSLRAGAGMYYDHFGEAIVNSFDQQGSFGLSGLVVTPADEYSVANTPRFTGPHAIPPTGCGAPPGTVPYPFTPSTVPGCDFAIAWGIDNQLKTPYSYDFDASLQIELPGGFVFEETYVGRFGRHLLEQLDLAQPVNLVDSGGGGDYFHAAAALSRFSDDHGGCYPGSGNGCTVPNVPAIKYFEDMFPQMKGYDYPHESATQAIYNNEWAANRYGLGETNALFDLDVACYYGCPQNGGNPRYWDTQFSSLFAWASIGTSSYNALQVTLRHPASHGLTTDVSYTLSKSLDLSSQAEHSNSNSSDAYAGAVIQNSWNPKLNKAPSDFDSRNLVSLDWVYDLPVGSGKSLFGSAGRLTDALIGNIEWSGLSRWSSALPFSTFAPGYTTDWQWGGAGVVTGSAQLSKHIVDGVPQIFAGTSANTINNGIYNGYPIRLPYPGEPGQRNYFRGDGYFDIDSALAKTWTLPGSMKLKLDAEVYNVPNSVRFDDSPLNLNTLLSSGTFGNYGGVLTTYRRMQFGLRIDY
jgi:hypothetical protein